MVNPWAILGVGAQPLLGAAGKLPVLPRAQRQPVQLPERQEAINPSTKEEMDKKIAQLNKSKASWTKLSCLERAARLTQCMDNFVASGREFSELGVASKGSYGGGLGEEWSVLIPAVLGLQEYIATLKAEGALPPLSSRPGPDGFTIAQVFPRGLLAMLFSGFVGEVWCKGEDPLSQGKLYKSKAAGKNPKAGGAVSLVLGAGNQISVVILDILHKLIAEDEVVLVKMSPVNESQGPLLEKAFEPLKEWVQFTYGGPEVGKYLCQSPALDSIHLTGSHHTFNAIVWGSPTAPRTGEPALKKVVTAELGCVTPYIIVPGGHWSDSDIAFHAKNIVAGMAQNSGHNCVALEVLVTAKKWSQRPQLMAAIKQELNASHQRAPWYPGSKQKIEAFKARFSKHKIAELGQCNLESSASSEAPANQGTTVECMPFLLVENLIPEEASLQEENWSAVLQEVALPGEKLGTDPAAFMTAAADFVNTQCWGTLSAATWIHPEVAKSVGEEKVDAFLASLNYGCIAVNAPSSICYALTALPWGAAPGSTLSEIGSGIGMVHNTLLLDHAVKGVTRVPWRQATKPLWHLDNWSGQSLIPQVLLLLSSLGRNTPAALFFLLRSAVAALCV